MGQDHLSGTCKKEEQGPTRCIKYDSSNDAIVSYLEENGNPHPKPLIIQYNLAPKPKVPFIIQVPA
ncbi:hypothetical protein CR513_29127, partial [Mucuna pruriens]